MARAAAKPKASAKTAVTNGDDKSASPDASTKVCRHPHRLSSSSNFNLLQQAATAPNKKRLASESVEKDDDETRPKRDAKKPKRLGDEAPPLAEHKVQKTSTKKTTTTKATARVKKSAASAAKTTTTKAAAKTVTKKTTAAKVTKKNADTKSKVTKKTSVKKTAGARRQTKKRSLSPEAVEKALEEKPKPAPRKRRLVAEVVVEEHKPTAPRYIKPRTKAVREFTFRSEKQLTVFVTGTGDMGEIGLGGHITEAKRPKLIPTLKDVGVVQTASGGMHTLCLTKDNKIYSWGVNDQGALGRPTDYEAPTRDADADSDSEDEVDLNPLESTPGLVEGLPEGKQFVKLAAGDSISIAVTEDGLVYGWGTFRNDEGILGFSETIDVARRPELIQGVQDVVDVACGVNHVLALTRYGKVYAWGSGGQFQLGRRIVERRAKSGLTPSEIGLASRIVAIGAGSYHSFAIDEKERVFAWGLNQFLQCGQLGPKQEYGEEDNTILTQPTEVKSLAGKHVVEIDGGEHHSIARCEDGTVLAWGRTDSHAVGLDFDAMDQEALYRNENNRPQFVKEPTVVPGIKASSITAGSNSSLAISAEDRGVYAWGYNDQYQCGFAGGDYIKTPQRIINDAVRDIEFLQISAGGQFSILSGAPAEKKAEE
ncbi:RCC1/BLIP-II [Ascobolus immersus RN42]|uniref:RCC1/BLIP-II n=1 Tax=Ascobolus immersus RN42 TaxID=1160509 RepID=A0A3N4IGB6_ASCIM|nr:RCC1/BLIP-II [Ascobolus immersus RN42]